MPFNDHNSSNFEDAQASKWSPESLTRVGRATSRLKLKSDLAAARMRVAFRRLCNLKAGFREDQPRWPQGSGENSGRWSGGGGSAAPSGGAKPRKRGHHIVPGSVADSPEFGLSDEARRAFEDETTGPLHGAPHGFSKLHEEYNIAVRDKLRDYLRERGIGGQSMTADDAEDFIKRVYRSDDPRIRQFNLYVFRQRLYNNIRRLMPRGRE